MKKASIWQKVVVGILVFGLFLVYGGAPIMAAQDQPADPPAEEEVPPADEDTEAELAEEPGEEADPEPEPVEEVIDEEVIEEEEIVLPEEPVVEGPVESEEPVAEEEEVDEMPEIEEPKEIEVVDEDVVEETPEPLETWEALGGGKYRTTEPVKLGQEYVYPDNSQFKLLFTDLPDPAGRVTVSQVSTADLALPEKASVAFEVTSEMANGSFQYDLVMPTSGVKEPKVVYTEDKVTFKEVAQGQTAGVSAGQVKASALDHFTIFVVIGGEDTTGFAPQSFTVGDLASLQTENGWGGFVQSEDRWPANAYDPGTYIQFDLDTALPADATINQATLHFTYARSFVGIFPWWWEQYGAKLQLLTGDEIDVWNENPWSFTRHDVDLTPYVSSGSDLESFQFMMYGSMPLFNDGMHTFHDWVALDVEWAPAAPKLVAPPDGSISKSDVEFDWDPVDGATEYEFEIIGDSSAMTPDTEMPQTLPGGTYDWHVRAYNADGNDGPWSETWSVTVDDVRPFVDAYSLSDEWVQNTGDLTFDYEVSDNLDLKVVKYAIWETNGDCDVETMNANVGGPIPVECRRASMVKHWSLDKDFVSGTTASAYGHAIDDSAHPLTDRTYMTYIRVKDRANNIAHSQRVWFGIDSTPPDVPEDLGFNVPPGDYAVPRPAVEVNCGDYTNANFEQKISHHWTDESASGAVEYQRQWMYPGGSTWNGAENWSTPYTNFRSFGGAPGTEGEWHVRVRARDTLGNWSDWSATDASDACSVTYDQTFPIVEITNPTDGDPIRGTVNITGTIDENIELSHYNLSLYPGDADPWDFSKRIWQQHVVGDNSAVAHSLDTTAFADGEYLIRLAARDKAGNRDPMGSSGDGVSVHVIRVVIDNTQPDVAWVNPLDSDTVNGLLHRKCRQPELAKLCCPPVSRFHPHY